MESLPVEERSYSRGNNEFRGHTRRFQDRPVRRASANGIPAWEHPGAGEELPDVTGRGHTRRFQDRPVRRASTNGENSELGGHTRRFQDRPVRRASANGIPAWEHPGVGEEIPDVTGRIPADVESYDGPKLNSMVITFNSDESCCPSLGDITCDYSEAQAFAAATTSAFEASTLPSTPAARRPQQNTYNNSHGKQKLSKLPSPTRKPNLVSSTRKNQMPQQRKGGQKLATNTARALASPSKSKKPVLRTTSKDYKYKQEECSVDQRMGDIVLPPFQSPTNIAAMSAEKMRSKKNQEVCETHQRSIQGVVVTPKFFKEKDGASRASGDGGSKRRSAGRRRDGTNRRPTGNSNENKPATRQVKTLDVKQAKKRETIPPQLRVDDLKTVTEIEDVCLRPTIKHTHSATGTVMASNTEDKEIVLHGSPEFRQPPLQGNESSNSINFEDCLAPKKSDLNNSLRTAQTESTTTTRTTKDGIVEEYAYHQIRDTNNSSERASSRIGDPTKPQSRLNLNLSRSSIQSYGQSQLNSSYSRGSEEIDIGSLMASYNDSVSLSNLEQSIRLNIDNDNESVSLAESEQEKEMVELALERSLHDYSFHQSSSRDSVALDGSGDGLSSSFCGSNDGSSIPSGRSHASSSVPSRTALLSDTGHSKPHLFDDDYHEDADEVDMSNIAMSSANTMHDSIGAISRYSPVNLEEEDTTFPSRYTMLTNDSMSRYSSKADLESCCADSVSRASSRGGGSASYASQSIGTDKLWRKDVASGRWFTIPDNDVEGMTEKEMMIQRAKDNQLTDTLHSSFGGPRDSVSCFDDSVYNDSVFS